MKNQMRIVTAILISMTMGCTKSRPYKELAKPELGVTEQPKSIIDETADYLYAPSTVESAMTASASRPHWMGDAKRVRFVFTEKNLKVVEPETDGRFASNPVNSRAVLTIPIEHLDYKCAEDDFGNCTRREVRNEDIPWNQKKFFIFKADDLAIQQLNFVPVEVESFFGGCFVEAGSEFIKAEINDQSVNLILEKTFQSKPGCIDFSTVEELADLSFTVRYQHSFVKLDALRNKDYKPLVYTRADETNFGFFTSRVHRLDVDNSDTLGSEFNLIDRWNPNRSEITYYLSSGFNKVGNESIKQAAAESVDAINNGLKTAGSRLRINLKDAPEGMSSGDLRQNMIVLEEDPQSAGVIGYGPHASNPLTGEILSAKVIMYAGTLKKYLKYSYDDLVQERLAKSSDSKLLTSQLSRLSLTGQAREKSQAAKSTLKISKLVDGRTLASLDHSKIDTGFAPALSISALKRMSLSPNQGQSFAKNLRQRLEFLSRHCEYPADLFNFDSAIDGALDGVLDEVGLKPWIELTEVERNKVLAVLMPFVFKPTLIHELGHNLGLRHNFAGSEDRDNFYSEKELMDMGVSRPFAYSSVMDYAHRTNNELRVLGKYDVAALKFAYQEQVELKDGQVISVEKLHANPNAEIKPYSYCTDEHVSANPNCNRFDEGSTLKEIATHYVNAYEARYKRANLRNDRRRFSLFQDSAQIGALDTMMSEMRLMFERYESIKNTFDLSDDDQVWKQIEFLKDLREAATIAGQFFIKIVKTPDVHCAVSESKTPEQVIAVVPIRAISRRAVSCFDQENIQLNPQYVIVAEGGKSYQSRKDPRSNDPDASQIDVRGVWMDKLMATHYLFARELGSSLFDQYTENFLNLPEIQNDVLNMMGQILLDEMSGPVTFHLQTGAEAELDVAYRLFDANDAANSHKLLAVLDDQARSLFGLPNETTLFHQLFVNEIERSIPSQAHASLADAVLGLFRVHAELPRDGRDKEYKSVDVNGRRMFVHPTSGLAMEVVKDLGAVETLSVLKPEELAKVKTALEKKDPKGLSEGEKKAYGLGADVITRFEIGGFQAPAFYSLIIQNLSRIL